MRGLLRLKFILRRIVAGQLSGVASAVSGDGSVAPFRSDRPDHATVFDGSTVPTPSCLGRLFGAAAESPCS